jgi:elongation factor P--(R)-beta-lysine ligase
MTREDYLLKKWRPYITPSPNLLSSSDWCWGKVQKTSDGQLWLLGSSEVLEISQLSLTQDELGDSVAVSFLCPGDSVGYDRRTKTCYLLSPNRVTSPTVDNNESQWQLFLDCVRAYFLRQGFRSWQTPTLLPSSGIDAHIDFFKAQGVRTGRTFALPTSPEFALKKALARGEKNIFEIKPCFRDDDTSPTHLAEFTMIEWYRAYADKWSLCDDFCGLVEFVAREMDLKVQPSKKIQKFSLAELFVKHLDFQLAPKTSKDELIALLQKRGLDWSPTDDWDDLFFRLYIEFIEPILGKEQPIAIYNFPLSQGSLSRATKEGWADRFEIYWQGIELANAYQEENNPQKIEERFLSEVEKRASCNREPHQIDSDFLMTMKMGFPPSTGIAVGLDRLWMVLNNQSSLRRT